MLYLAGPLAGSLLYDACLHCVLVLSSSCNQLVLFLYSRCNPVVIERGARANGSTSNYRSGKWSASELSKRIEHPLVSTAAWRLGNRQIRISICRLNSFPLLLQRRECLFRCCAAHAADIWIDNAGREPDSAIAYRLQVLDAKPANAFCFFHALLLQSRDRLVV